MQRVLVLSSTKQPLMPCHPARARDLLKKGRAAVFRRYPFTIILKDRTDGEVQDMQFADEFGFPQIQAKAKLPLKDAAAINVTRWKLFGTLRSTGLPLEVGSGGRTKFNRTVQGHPKTHWLDAVCVGESGQSVFVHTEHQPLHIQAVGRQSRQMCRVDKFGFPRTGAKQARVQRGFQTGDMVKAIVTQGKKIGTYIGRVAVRHSGYFNITTREATVQGISYRCCTPLHKSDGYYYLRGEAASSTR